MRCQPWVLKHFKNQIKQYISIGKTMEEIKRLFPFQYGQHYKESWEELVMKEFKSICNESQSRNPLQG